MGSSQKLGLLNQEGGTEDGEEAIAAYAKSSPMEGNEPRSQDLREVVTLDDRSVRFARAPWRGTTACPARGPVQHAAGRCTEPGCDARTSIYNRNDTCWLHTKVSYPMPPGGRTFA
jgi:hypothetical protein